jgi:signal peptidase II
VYRRRAFAIAVCVVAADQVSKALAVAFLEYRAPIPILGEWLQLSFTRNPGAAFSIGTGMTWVFTAFAFLVSVVLVRAAANLTHRGWATALGATLGGALGNLADRLFRSPGPLRGHVVDFIALPNYPLFNIADSALVCAAIVMAWYSLRGVDMRS